MTKKEITPARLKRIRIVRESIDKVVKILSSRRIRVVQQGTLAAVQYDNRTMEPVCVYVPVIPDDASDELIDAIQGFIDHEVAHLLYTDHLVGVEATHMGKHYHFFWNALEDCFIERRVVKDYSGSITNLNRTRRLFAERFVDPKFKETLARSDAKPLDFWNVLCVCAIRAWAGQQELVDYMADKWKYIEDVSKSIGTLKDDISKPANSRECLSLAVKMYHAVYGKPKPQEDEDDQDDDDSGDSKKNGKPGDSSGAGAGGKSMKQEAEFEADPDSDEEESSGDSEGDDSDDSDESNEGDQDSDEEGDGTSGDSEESESDSDEEGDDSASDQDSDEEGDDEAPSFGSEDEGEDEEGDDSASQEGDGGDSDADATTDGENDSMEQGDDSGLDPDALGNDDVSPPFEETDFDPSQPDFDKVTQDLISKLAQRDHSGSDYVPYTTEYDRIERFDYASRVNTPSHVALVDRHYKDMEEGIKDMVGTMQKNLERAFVAMNRSRWEAGHRRGKLNGTALSRVLTDDDRLFRRREEVKTKATDVSLVIDCSGSMSGNQIRMAMQAAWALGETLERLHVPCEIIGFTTAPVPHDLYHTISHDANRGNYHRFDPIYMPIFKDWNERFGVEQKRRMVAFSCGFGNLAQNVDGESIQYAAERLMRQNNPGKTMIVLSDGMPSCGAPMGLIGHLKRIAAAIEKSGVNLVGIGINTDAPKSFYRKAVVLRNIQDLAKTVLGELRTALLQK